MTGSTAAIVRRWSDHGCSAKIKMRALRRSPSRNLDFDAVSSNQGVVTAAASGSNVTLTGVSAGRATVTVTATDPDGLSVQQPVSVSVEPSGSAPVAVGDLPGRSLEVGGVAIFDARALLPRPRGCRPELRRGHVGPNPDSARRCPPSDPATVPRPSAPPRTPRCPRPSLHPLQPLRRCSGPSPMPPAGNPPAIPCRQGRGSADQVLPSLSHVARSGVSERSPTLLDSRQWSCPCLLSVPVPTQGPFPRRALPPRPRYYGPIRHPAGPACPSRGSGCRRARHRQGFPCCYAFHLPCMPTPLPRRKPAGCPVALFPASRRPSPCHRRIGFRITPFRGLLGVHFTFRPAWSLNRLPT